MQGSWTGGKICRCGIDCVMWFLGAFSFFALASGLAALGWVSISLVGGRILSDSMVLFWEKPCKVLSEA